MRLLLDANLSPSLVAPLTRAGHDVVHVEHIAYNTDSLIEFLTDLHDHFDGEKVTLIWDGLPSHRSKQMKAWIASQRRWLVVEQPPGYAYDLNPIEMVWGNVKQVELANLCPDTIDEAQQVAEAGLERIGSSRRCSEHRDFGCQRDVHPAGVHFRTANWLHLQWLVVQLLQGRQRWLRRQQCQIPDTSGCVHPLGQRRGCLRVQVRVIDVGAQDVRQGLIATRTASSANMSLTRLAASTSTSADLRFIVNAQNPFCTSFGNAIEGAFTMTVKQAGTWSIISGSHRQMPNWEIYIARGGLAAPTWTTVYQRSYASVACLVAIACTYANMSGRVGSY